MVLVAETSAGHAIALTGNKMDWIDGQSVYAISQMTNHTSARRETIMSPSPYLARRLLNVIVLIIGVLTITYVEPAAAQLVNSSFETPTLPGSFMYNPTGAGVGWTFADKSGVQANGSAWAGASAPDGSQTAFIQNLGAISQSVNLNAGSYTLSLETARRAYSSPAGSNLQPIKVTIDGQQIGDLVSPADTSFSSVSIPFSIAGNGAHTLRFAGTVFNAGDDRTTFIDTVTIAAAATAGPKITSGSTNLYPNGFLYVLGSDFGPPAGKITIHFPKKSAKAFPGGSYTDLDVPIGSPANQWWYSGLAGGTVLQGVTGVVEQTVDIVLTTKDGKKSNAWKAKFHPRTELVALPQSHVKVVSCSDDGVANSCNHKGDESSGCFDGFATEGIPPAPTDSFGGHHHGCFGFTGDSGVDVFSASLKNGWKFDSVTGYQSSTWDNGTATAPLFFPMPLVDSTSTQFQILWGIGALGGSIAYEGTLMIRGPKDVGF